MLSWLRAVPRTLFWTIETVLFRTNQRKLQLASAAPDPGICYGGGGLPEGRQLCEAVWTEEGGAVRLRRGGGGGGGGEGAVDKSHSLLKHKEHHGKRVHSAPALSCSTASLTFVRTTELSGLLSMAQHIICRSLSSGRGGGGGAAKAAGGRHFIRDGGGGRPPQGYAGSGAEQAKLQARSTRKSHNWNYWTPAGREKKEEGSCAISSSFLLLVLKRTVSIVQSNVLGTALSHDSIDSY